MYNFKMSKKEQSDILDACNFNETERFIFNHLAEDKPRKEIYVLAKESLGISESTVNRTIKRLIKKIEDVKGENSFIYKIYMHKFPNGKKYIGVCQSCVDRWNNGNGYAYNKEMYKDIQKYGWDNIEHKILLEVNSSSLAYEIEKVFIDELNLISEGYNNK